MQKKFRIKIIGGCALLIILVLLVVLIQSNTKSVVGTFCTGEGISQEDVYVSIYSDDTFLIYKQFDVISSGSCSIDEYKRFSVITFIGKDGDQTVAIYDKSDTLLLFEKMANGPSGPTELNRISKTPLEINVTPPE